MYFCNDLGKTVRNEINFTLLMEQIYWNPSSNDHTDAKFSIIIPTWNNLELLEICINSIQKNSHFKHQVILHINEGNDGTLQWAKEHDIDYSYSKNNVGVCLAMNACRSLVKTEYMVYLNDDMYVLPNWDLELWKEIEQLPNPYFFLSSTTIEGKPSPHPGIVAPFNYGTEAADFKEEKLLNEYQSLPAFDWDGATWPPNIIHRDIWDLVGGYSIEYTPGMYSDPDFSMKLLKVGVTYFKGVRTSMAYHFGSKSTTRIKKNNGRRQFTFKWGITAKAAMLHLLQRGQPFSGRVHLQEKIKSAGYQKEKRIARLKRILWSFGHTGEANEY